MSERKQAGPHVHKWFLLPSSTVVGEDGVGAWVEGCRCHVARTVLISGELRTDLSRLWPENNLPATEVRGI